MADVKNKEFLSCCRRKCEVGSDMEAKEPKDLTANRAMLSSAHIKMR